MAYIKFITDTLNMLNIIKCVNQQIQSNNSISIENLLRTHLYRQTPVCRSAHGHTKKIHKYNSI